MCFLFFLCSCYIYLPIVKTHSVTCADPEFFSRGGGGGVSDGYLSLAGEGAYFRYFYYVNEI